MIEKLDIHNLDSLANSYGREKLFLDKINEIIDVVNNNQKALEIVIKEVEEPLKRLVEKL